MPIPAQGKWPSNVTAQIITKEEKEAMQAGLNLPAPIPGQPAISVAEQHAQEKELNEVIGRAALITAYKFGLNHVWLTATKNPIALDDAESLVRKDPGLVYFDFDRLEDELAAAKRVESANEPSVSETVIEPELQPDVIDELAFSGLVEPPKLSPEPEALPLPPNPIREAELSPNLHTVTERERRAWGGVLTSPGQQVYVHPSGIVRVEIEGPITLQKAIVGETRILRITRISVQPTPTPKAVSTSPQKTVSYRQLQAPKPRNEKIPIPEPKQVTGFDESEF